MGLTKTPLVVEVGTGKEAKAGVLVEVNYVGRLASNGKEFDSNRGKKPFSFRLGQGAVIQGWDKGVPGMKEGGKRKLRLVRRDPRQPTGLRQRHPR